MWPRLGHWLQIVLNATAYLAHSIILSGPFQWAAYQPLQTPRPLLKDQRCRKSVCSKEHSLGFFSRPYGHIFYMLCRALPRLPPGSNPRWDLSFEGSRSFSSMHSLLPSESISHPDISFSESTRRGWDEPRAALLRTCGSEEPPRFGCAAAARGEQSRTGV